MQRGEKQRRLCAWSLPRRDGRDRSEPLIRSCAHTAKKSTLNRYFLTLYCVERYWANHPSVDAEVEDNLAERNRHPHKWTGIRADYISNAEYDLLLAPLLKTFRPEQVTYKNDGAAVFLTL